MLALSPTQARAATVSISGQSASYSNQSGLNDTIQYGVSAFWTTPGYCESSSCWIKVKYYDYSGVLQFTFESRVASQASFASPVSMTIYPTYQGYDYATGHAPSGIQTAVYYYYFDAAVNTSGGVPVVTDYKDTSANACTVPINS
jgi:hypothetical protein